MWVRYRNGVLANASFTRNKLHMVHAITSTNVASLQNRSIYSINLHLFVVILSLIYLSRRRRYPLCSPARVTAACVDISQLFRIPEAVTDRMHPFRERSKLPTSNFRHDNAVYPDDGLVSPTDRP